MSALGVLKTLRQCTLMVPNMLRTTASIALAVAAVSGCSGATTGSGQPSAPASTTTATASTVTPSPTTSAQGVALTIPGTINGEVSRTVLRLTPGTFGTNNASTIGEPVKGRSYVVRSACSAPAASAVTITYRLIDARADSTNRTTEERTMMSSPMPCDGKQHVEEVGPLAFPVTVYYDAYTIVAPQ
jgi:hypothetical protein